MMSHEDRTIRLRRLRLRSMRRGIREMDLILSAFADDRMAGLEPDMLDLYERLLGENDHDLYGWIAGSLPVPEGYAPLIDRIAAGASGLTRPER